jgi:hypothetical protein
MKTPIIGPSGPGFLSLVLLLALTSFSNHRAALSGFTWSNLTSEEQQHA